MLCNRTFLSVHLVNHDAIHPEVWHKGEIPIGREAAPVWVRAVLTIANDFRTSLMLMKRRRTRQFPINFQLETGRRSATILSGEQEFPRRVNSHMRTSPVANRRGIEKR